MSGDENKALVRLILEEAFNKGNLDVADGLFRDDYVAHVPGRQMPTGPQAFKATVGMWRSAFADIHMTIEAVVGDGDLVANRFTTRGTHTGPLMGLPPTGEKMVVHGQELYRLEDGKVAESWICDDVPSILVQLGVLAMLSAGPATAGRT